jgi:hypothetical protein
MGRRRRREDHWIAPVAQLLGLLFILGMLSPQVRQAMFALGFLAICALIVAMIGLIGFVVYRFATRAQRTLSHNPFVSSPRTEAAVRVVNLSSLEVQPPAIATAPQTSADTDTAFRLLKLAAIEAWAPTKGTAPQTTVELLEQLRSIDWFQFEKLVALAYRKLGYIVTRRGGANPDGGIDLVIEKDGQVSAVQCKQWKTWNVGVKAVREFLGALTHADIQRGIFITLRGYTGDAKQLAEEHGIEIVNEVGLAQMLEETDAVFDPETLDILSDTRKFCPKCESEMVLRTATKGPGAGSQFWGCSAYPRCRFIMPKN